MKLKTDRSDDAMLGCLLGGAVGDALGLPAEGLSRRRLHRMWHGEWRHRFVGGRGMFSDDTEHTLMVGAALIRHHEDEGAFQRELARSLRWWLAALPAGTGLATARSIIRLWCGVSPERSGVRSAGNGAAMRSAIVGVYFADDADRRQTFVRASTRITHTDPRAEEGAQLVAEAAALAVRGVDAQASLGILRPLLVSDEMKDRFSAIERSLSGAETVARYAERIGCGEGVSGFAPNTVAVALYAWLRHRGDFRSTLTSAMACGGDVDSVGAIVGGIAGAEAGEAGIPAEWIQPIADWPRSIGYVRRLASALAEARAHGATRVPSLLWPAILARNALFLVIVLLHGLRRLLPPY